MVFGFDIDGVLCDIESHILLGCIRAGLLPKGTTVSDINARIDEQFNICYDDINSVLNLELYRHITPHWHVVADIRRWIEGGEQIIYCTARSDKQTPGIQDLTVDCLDEWGVFEGSLGVHFLMSEDKYLLANEVALTTFTDDYDVVLNLMEGIVPHLFLMQADANKACVHRQRLSWDAIARKIDDIIIYGSDKMIESAMSAEI